jgi:hypothetical protein
MKLYTLQNNRPLKYSRNSHTVWDVILTVITSVAVIHCVEVPAAADVAKLTAPSSSGSGSPRR